MKCVVLDLLKLKNPNSGLGQYCLSLAQGLQDIPQNDIEFKFLVPKNFNNVFQLKNIVYEIPDCDLLHKTHQESRLSTNSRNTKVLLTIHDLNFLIKYKKNWIKSALKKFILQRRIYQSDALNFISKFTESQVLDNFFIYQKNTKVIYNGINPPSKVMIDLPKNLTEKKFLLSIGIVQPKKNLELIFPILENEKSLDYVIAGPLENLAYYEKLKKMIQERGLGNRIHFLGSVSEEMKSALYQNAYCYVFPSASEGFGLPVIEAFSYGLPVFLNNKGALPELGKNLAMYFDSDFPDNIFLEFVKGMQASPSADHQNLLKQYALQFSRENFALNYFNYYKEIIYGK